MHAWARKQGIEDERLTLKPEDLGLRTTYLATGPVTGTSVPVTTATSPSRSRRAMIEAHDLEARGRARATVTRRPCIIAGFYKYAVEE